MTWSPRPSKSTKSSQQCKDALFVGWRRRSYFRLLVPPNDLHLITEEGEPCT